MEKGNVLILQDKISFCDSHFLLIRTTSNLCHKQQRTTCQGRSDQPHCVHSLADLQQHIGARRKDSAKGLGGKFLLL